LIDLGGNNATEWLSPEIRGRSFRPVAGSFLPASTELWWSSVAHELVSCFVSLLKLALLLKDDFWAAQGWFAASAGALRQ